MLFPLLDLQIAQQAEQIENKIRTKVVYKQEVSLKHKL